MLVSFRLYDANGKLTADSEGFSQYPEGITVKCKGGELLLRLPSKANAPVQYRLYSSSGMLLTWSDGSRTKIYPNLRMEGVARGWSLPTANGNGTNGNSPK